MSSQTYNQIEVDDMLAEAKTKINQEWVEWWKEVSIKQREKEIEK